MRPSREEVVKSFALAMLCEGKSASLPNNVELERKAEHAEKRHLLHIKALFDAPSAASGSQFAAICRHCEKPSHQHYGVDLHCNAADSHDFCAAPDSEKAP